MSDLYRDAQGVWEQLPPLRHGGGSTDFHGLFQELSVSCPPSIDPQWFAVVLCIMVLLLVVFALWAGHRVHHWKTLYENEQDEREAERERAEGQYDGWVEEARFWRHHFDQASAKWADEDTQQMELSPLLLRPIPGPVADQYSPGPDRRKDGTT